MFWENSYVYFIKLEKIVYELLKFTVYIPIKVNRNKIQCIKMFFRKI